MAHTEERHAHPDKTAFQFGGDGFGGVVTVVFERNEFAERAVEFRRAFSMMFDAATIRAALERARRELTQRVRGPADE